MDAPQPASAPPRPEVPPDTPVAQKRDLFRAGPDTFAPRFDRLFTTFPPHVVFFPPGYFFPGASYFPFGPSSVPHVPSRGSRAKRHEATPAAPGGYLRLQIEPATAEVYVDGYYVGIADDFALLRGAALEAGPHRVEIRAPGFEAVGVDVRILSNQTVTYRAVLQRIADPPASRGLARSARDAAAVPPPKTLYVIPGCYAGDKLPRADQLRAGCRAADVRVISPGP